MRSVGRQLGTGLSEDVGAQLRHSEDFACMYEELTRETWEVTWAFERFQVFGWPRDIFLEPQADGGSSMESI